MEISLRPAMPRDTPALASLFLEVRRSTFTWRDASTFALEDFEAQTVAEDITIAENEHGELLGFVSVWEPESFIHHLFVATSAQGMGVGRRLLASLLPWLPLPHRLKCAEPNASALAFYRKLGWIEIARGESSDGCYRLLEWNRPLGTTNDAVVITANSRALPSPAPSPATSL